MPNSNAEQHRQEQLDRPVSTREALVNASPEVRVAYKKKAEVPSVRPAIRATSTSHASHPRSIREEEADLAGLLYGLCLLLASSTLEVGSLQPVWLFGMPVAETVIAISIANYLSAGASKEKSRATGVLRETAPPTRSRNRETSSFRRAHKQSRDSSGSLPRKWSQSGSQGQGSQRRAAISP